MTIIEKEPNKKPQVIEQEGNIYDNLSDLFFHMEDLGMQCSKYRVYGLDRTGLVMICGQDLIAANGCLEYNFTYQSQNNNYHEIYGAVIFARIDKKIEELKSDEMPELTDITDEDIRLILNLLSPYQQDEYRDAVFFKNLSHLEAYVRRVRFMEEIVHLGAETLQHPIPMTIDPQKGND